MAYVTVDVDLVDFDFDDVISFVIKKEHRLKNHHKVKLKQMFKNVADIDKDVEHLTKSSADNDKFNLYAEHCSKFTLEQFEDFLKSLKIQI